MKKRILLSASICCFIASVAMAAEAPGPAPVSPTQAPVAAKTPDAATVSENAAVYTIEALYKNGAELNKKKVMVHGLVVKMTSGIKGKSWTHIQDGTGDKSKGTNDVICISSTDRGEVGDQVTVAGTVIFIPESRYKLVLEDAIISK